LEARFTFIPNLPVLQAPPASNTMSESSAEVNIEQCTDQDLLSKMLMKTEDFDLKKKIRARLKELYELEATLHEMARTSSAGAAGSEDALKLRAERLQKEKEAELKSYAELAKLPGVGALQGGSERVKQLEQEAAEQSKARQLKQFNEMAKHVEARPAPLCSMKSKASPGGGESASKSAMNKFKAMDRAASKTQQQNDAASAKKTGSSLKRSQSAVLQSGSAAVKQWQAAAAVATAASGQPGAEPKPVAPSGGRGLKRTQSAATIKQCLLDWCKAVTAPYRQWGVEVTNLSSSWGDGLAFCALIHSFHPEAFDFNELSAANRKRNFELAFDTAEKYAGIAPLLDVEDMVTMATPDWKCVFTYLQMFYKKFRNFNKSKPST
uniref:Calponin-homology (CH) domain-containing protein n=1 Tax=Macrostomum lignano TaxID=282301 RepID=A0A1I8IPA3_9PLAT